MTLTPKERKALRIILEKMMRDDYLIQGLCLELTRLREDKFLSYNETLLLHDKLDLFFYHRPRQKNKYWWPIKRKGPRIIALQLFLEATK